MGLPETGIITGQITTATGGLPGAAGTITFTPTHWAGYPSRANITNPAAVTVPVDASGNFSATLARTDTGKSPGWCYRVTVNAPNVDVDPFWIVVEAASANIADCMVPGPGQPSHWAGPPWSVPDGRYSLIGHDHDGRYPSHAELASLIQGITGVDVSGVLTWRGDLAVGTDLDAVRGAGWQGVWEVINSRLASYGGTWPATPTGTRWYGTVLVFGRHSALRNNSAQIMAVTHPARATGLWWRMCNNYNVTGPNAWGPWRRLDSESDIAALRADLTALQGVVAGIVADGGGPGSNAGIANRQLLDQFVRARGGSIGTGGKASVAIRWDHYPDAAIASGLPALHRDRGIPIGWCHYSQQQGLAGHTTSWATLQSLALSHGLEVFGHSQTHADATDTAAYVRELATSRQELEAAMPQVRVDGFCIPGVGGSNYNGWINTNSIDDFYEREPGRIALENYAYVSGHMGGTQHPQTGQVEQGLAHIYLQTMTLTQAIDAITAAQAAGTKIQLMIHPHVIGTTGFISVEDYTALLDHIAAERDAGRLAVLSLSGWALADARHSYRDDLAAGNTLAGSLSGSRTWTVPMAERGWARGSVRETLVEVSCPAGTGATVTLTRNGVTAGTLTIPAGDTATHRLRRCHYISLTARQDITLATTQPVQISAVRLLAV